jgi:hypothetical protein
VVGKVSLGTLTELDAAFERYEAEVQAAGLQPMAVKTYLLHSRNFIRWLRDDFTPGAKLKR